MIATGYMDYCERCERKTPTALAPLTSGHVGRLCMKCRACRPRQPYASKKEYEQLKAETEMTGRGRHAKFIGN